MVNDAHRTIIKTYIKQHMAHISHLKISVDVEESLPSFLSLIELLLSSMQDLAHLHLETCQPEALFDIPTLQSFITIPRKVRHTFLYNE